MCKAQAAEGGLPGGAEGPNQDRTTNLPPRKTVRSDVQPGLEAPKDFSGPLSTTILGALSPLRPDPPPANRSGFLTQARGQILGQSHLTLKG